MHTSPKNELDPKNILVSMHLCEDFQGKNNSKRNPLRFAISNIKTTYSSSDKEDDFYSLTMLQNGVHHSLYFDQKVGETEPRTTGVVINPKAVTVVYGGIKGGSTYGKKPTLVRKSDKKDETKHPNKLVRASKNEHNGIETDYLSTDITTDVTNPNYTSLEGLINYSLALERKINKRISQDPNYIHRLGEILASTNKSMQDELCLCLVIDTSTRKGKCFRDEDKKEFLSLQKLYQFPSLIIIDNNLLPDNIRIINKDIEKSIIHINYLLKHDPHELTNFLQNRSIPISHRNTGQNIHQKSQLYMMPSLNASSQNNKLPRNIKLNILAATLQKEKSALSIYSTKAPIHQRFSSCEENLRSKEWEEVIFPKGNVLPLSYQANKPIEVFTVVDLQKSFRNDSNELPVSTFNNSEYIDTVIKAALDQKKKNPNTVFIMTRDWHENDSHTFSGSHKEKIEKEKEIFVPYENLREGKIQKITLKEGKIEKSSEYITFEEAKQIAGVLAYYKEEYSKNPNQIGAIFSNEDYGVDTPYLPVWTSHCIKNTDGANFDEKLEKAFKENEINYITVNKGTLTKGNGYGWEEGTNIEELIKTLNIGRAMFCGTVTNVCVNACMEHTASLIGNSKCTAIIDACAPLEPEANLQKTKQWQQKGINVINSSEITERQIKKR
jgi:nicotinamidase-related amidase